MADVKNFVSHQNLTGERVLPNTTGKNCTEFHLRFKGDTGDITVEVVGRGLDKDADRENPGADGENIVSAGTGILISVGAVDYFVITPTNLSNTYQVDITGS